jgi:hypothetical protein
MSTVSVTAGEIMDSAAALMNDTQKQVYTYVVQLPYLKIAIKDLRKKLQLANIPITNETSAAISVLAGTTVIGFATTPALPASLVEIQKLWERFSSSDPFVGMTRKDSIPHYLEREPSNRFQIWAWESNEIRLIAANRNNEIKIDYIEETVDLSTLSSTSAIGIINADSYLHFRTAALCAEFVAENKTRADDLNGEANNAYEILAGIEDKAKQAIATRHRPFRAGFKSRSSW